MANRTYRAKKIDYSKGLPVHLSTDIADFEENVFAIRSVPQVSTGVEKEEEEVRFIFSAVFSFLSSCKTRIIEMLLWKSQSIQHGCCCYRDIPNVIGQRPLFHAYHWPISLL